MEISLRVEFNTFELALLYISSSTPTSGSISTWGETSCSDCPRSPIFPWDFRGSYVSIEIPPSWFNREGRVFKLPRGEGVGRRSTQRTLTRVASFSSPESPGPLSRWRLGTRSLDTLPRLLSPLQTYCESSTEVYESRKSHGKIGDCDQSTSCYPFKGLYLLKLS